MLINARTVKSTAYTSVGLVTVKADVVTKRKKVDHQAAHVQAYCRWIRRSFN